MDRLPPTLFWLTTWFLCSVLPKLTDPLLNTLEILTLKILLTVGMLPASIPFIIWSGRMNRHSRPAHMLVCAKNGRKRGTPHGRVPERGIEVSLGRLG